MKTKSCNCISRHKGCCCSLSVFGDVNKSYANGLANLSSRVHMFGIDSSAPRGFYPEPALRIRSAGDVSELRASLTLYDFHLTEKRGMGGKRPAE